MLICAGADMGGEDQRCSLPLFNPVTLRQGNGICGTSFRAIQEEARGRQRTSPLLSSAQNLNKKVLLVLLGKPQGRRMKN
jgi:hypothetical protein